MDVVLAIAGVVSALAALGALWFAYQTVRETRALRREDRLARLPELVEEIVEEAIVPGTSFHGKWVYPVKRRRFSVALAALGDRLPACEEIASGDRYAKAGELAPDDVRDRAIEALDELMHAGR